MSKTVKRYDIESYCGCSTLLELCYNGDYVLFSDYQELQNQKTEVKFCHKDYMSSYKKDSDLQSKFDKAVEALKEIEAAYPDGNTKWMNKKASETLAELKKGESK